MPSLLTCSSVLDYNSFAGWHNSCKRLGWLLARKGNRGLLDVYTRMFIGEYLTVGYVRYMRVLVGCR
jgi:hypothetical protein